MFFPNLSSDSSDMCNYLKSNRIPDICYVMSLNTTYDGNFYKMDDIFNTEIIKYIHCILCIPDKLVYLIGEGPRGIVISK